MLLGTYAIAEKKIAFTRLLKILFLSFWGACVGAVFLNAWQTQSSIALIRSWNDSWKALDLPVQR
jgi:formate/nitrite transporter FocA (FNT family)